MSLVSKIVFFAFRNPKIHHVINLVAALDLQKFLKIYKLRNLISQFALSTKVIYFVASGSFGKRSTFGETYLLENYLRKSKSDFKWNTPGGIKFAFTQANLKISEYSLPHDYQFSLETFELLASVGLNIRKWDFNAPVQIQQKI